MVFIYFTVVLVQFLVNMSRSGWTTSATPYKPMEWLNYIYEIGLIAGSLVASQMLAFCGRKCTLWLVTVLYFVSWSSLIAIGHTYFMLSSQFLLGLGNGINMVASPIYITEICFPPFRAIGGAALVIASHLGALWGFKLTWNTSRIWTAIANVVIAILVILSFSLSVEPTYDLVTRGVKTKTRKTLKQLTLDQSNVDEELTAIQRYVDEEERKKKSFRALFMNLGNLKALFVAVNYSVLCAISGHHVVLTVARNLSAPSFQTANFIWFYTLHFVVLIVSLFSVEKIDRRTLFRWCYVSLTIFNVCATILMRIPIEKRPTTFYSRIMSAGIFLYTIAYTFIQPVAIIAASEILPHSIKATGGAVCVIAQMTASFFMINFLPMAQDIQKSVVNFFVYTVLNVIMAAVCWKMLPETRGKALYSLHQ